MSKKVAIIKVNCLQCMKEFETKQARINAGRGKYCSRTYLAIAKLKDTAVKFTKGHKTWNKGKAHTAIRGDKHYRYQGGWWIDEDGYKMLEVKRLGKRYRIPEHRAVMEKELKRKLEQWEDVHHIDGNKLNNNPHNLAVLTKREHTLRHLQEGKVMPHYPH